MKKEISNRSEAEVICDLQRDLCYAEQVSGAIILMTDFREDDEQNKLILVLDNQTDNKYNYVFANAYKAVCRKMAEYDLLKEENKKLREQLQQLEKNKEKTSDRF